MVSDASEWVGRGACIEFVGFSIDVVINFAWIRETRLGSYCSDCAKNFYEARLRTKLSASLDFLIICEILPNL